MKSSFKEITQIFRTMLVPMKSVLLFISEFEALISRKWASMAHKRLFYITWGIKNTPEFFDHHIDLYFYWNKSGRSDWLERGVYGALGLKKDGMLLELACGDGFMSKNFYSNISKSIIACDFDSKAIATANRKNRAENIKYILADIRSSMPLGDFDNIIWNTSIEHFTVREIEAIMESIKKRLKKNNGLLCGHTIVERAEGKSLPQHEYEFKDMADLQRFLTPHFKNVTVFETIYSERHNLYFWASDGSIPFSNNWRHWIQKLNQNI